MGNIKFLFGTSILFYFRPTVNQTFKKTAKETNGLTKTNIFSISELSWLSVPIF